MVRVASSQVRDTRTLTRTDVFVFTKSEVHQAEELRSLLPISDSKNRPDAGRKDRPIATISFT